MTPASAAAAAAAPLPWNLTGAAAVDPLPALVAGGVIDARLLQALADGMRAEGLALQPQRLRYDRPYALERLAAAHCAADAGLRGLALQLFTLYQPAN